MTDPAPLLLIGTGSPFGADRVGLDVIAHIGSEPALLQRLPRGTRLLVRDRPGPSLIDDLQQATAVVIVDAVIASGETEALLTVSFEQLDAGGVSSSVSSHGLGVSQTLQLARSLGVLPGSLAVIGVNVTGRLHEPYAVDEVASLASAIAEQARVLALGWGL